MSEARRLEQTTKAEEAGPPVGPASIVVWDPLVRIFHWTVVLGCVLDLFVLEGGAQPHEVIGYVIAGALLARVAWGFVGTRHARFSDFVPSPARLVGYLSAMRRGRESRYLGHNPAGAVMMLALMLLLAGVSITGWMQSLDAFWGVAWVQDGHHIIADVILWLALLHAAAALWESARHRENLVLSMITGRKRCSTTRT
jgi:cytochrome b